MGMSDLYTDRDYFDTKFGNIDSKLTEFNEHFKRLNGTVAKHEKIINEHLPHNVAHCTQAENIKQLRDNMVTEKAVKKTLYIGFGIICTLIATIYGVMAII